MDKKLNRIKVILADRGLTNKWLAETIHRDPATISKWVTNATWKISRIRSAGNCKKCPLKKRSFQRTLCVC